MDTKQQDAPNKLTIVTARLSDGMMGEGKRFTGFDKSYLTFDSVEDCLKVIELAHVEAWVICPDDDTWLRNRILEAPIVTEIEAREKAKQNSYIAEQHRHTAELNSKPRFAVVRFPDSQVVLERTISRYDPKESSHVMSRVHITIVTPDGINHNDFYLANFMAQHRRYILHKKLLSDMQGCNWKLTRTLTLQIDKKLLEIDTIKNSLACGNYEQAVDIEGVKKLSPKYKPYDGTKKKGK